MQLNEFLQMTGLTLKIEAINNKYVINFEEEIKVCQNPLLKDSPLIVSDSLQEGLKSLTINISNKTIWVNDSRKYEVPLIDLY